MQLDPVIELSLRTAFLALFAGSLIHKLLKLDEFKGTVASYLRGLALTSEVSTMLVAAAVIAGEAAVVVVCIAPVIGTSRALAIAIMLLLYAVAMAVNLRRGNSLLDCGCTWGSARQPVGYDLVSRNLVLCAVALTLMLPVGTREMHALDVVTVFAATLFAALAYASVNRLFTSAALISGRG